ncbi:helix-turn-helix domain-containing protein [Floccifex sp.]|uniref:helix-turn-helix domain-containing protein n=1 Tax=Floccifex sp. TaxID=2815810 RepID=UPI003EFC8FBA
MNQNQISEIIRNNREKRKMTQMDLAKQLYVSDKTISKWETSKSCPDLEMMEAIARVFQMSIFEFLSNQIIETTNKQGNCLKAHFYVCPICGNVLWTLSESMVHCHGISLSSLQAQKTNEDHFISIQKIENEYFVSISHEMTKKHYISFIAAVSSNRIQFVKLYPEQNAEAYFKIDGVKFIYFYCNQEGLFKKRIDYTMM